MKYSSMRGRVLMSLLALVMMIPMGVTAQSDAPFGVQVVRQPALLMAEDGVTVIGFAEYWNTRNNFIVEFALDPAFAGEVWRFADIQVYAGEEKPTLKKDSLVPGKFPCNRDLEDRKKSGMVSCSLKDELAHTWGGDQTRFVSLHGDLVMVDASGEIVLDESGEVIELGFYGMPITETVTESGVTVEFDDADVYENGSVFTTKFAHPRKGHFIDSPVGGLTYATPTNWGTTEDSGGFDYFPGEMVELWVGSVRLGSALADQKISPLDLFMADINDPRVVNMARLLQSLDNDHSDGKINIRPVVAACLDTAKANEGITEVDFSLDGQIEALILETMAVCDGNPEEIVLEMVSAEEAQGNLEAGLNASGIFRKNVSKTEDWGETKQKLEVMPVLRRIG